MLAIVIGLIAAVANAAERTGTRTSLRYPRRLRPIRKRLKASRSTLVWRDLGRNTVTGWEYAETFRIHLGVGTREGDMLVIRMPIKKATPSASGKTLVVASTRGNQRTAVQIDGKDVYLGVSAYVNAEPKSGR